MKLDMSIDIEGKSWCKCDALCIFLAFRCEYGLGDWYPLISGIYENWFCFWRLF